MTDQGWRQYAGGRRWRILTDGQIEVEGEGIPRTGGEPLTMRRLMDQHGASIMEAARRFDIPPEWIMGMIPIEALMPAHKDGGRVADVVSLRHEPGYTSDLETPRRVSAGLTQTLLSTAQAMAKKHGMGVPRLARELYDPHTSILLGAAYMADRRDAYENGVEGHTFDFVHLTGAYNAGRVRQDKSAKANPFHMLTYGQTRTERAIRWHNDAVAVLREAKPC